MMKLCKVLGLFVCIGAFHSTGWCQQKNSTSTNVHKRVMYNDINLEGVMSGDTLSCELRLRLLVTPEGLVDTVSMFGTTQCPAKLVQQMMSAARVQLRFSPVEGEESEIIYYTVRIISRK